jgi:hypothetical protein
VTDAPEPYSPTELEKVSSLIHRFNSPHSPQRRLLATLQAERAEKERLRDALEQIAHFDDAHMETARTLHYDMRGWARAVLATSNETEQKAGALSD